MFSIHVAVEWKPNTIRKHSYANLISRNTNTKISHKYTFTQIIQFSTILKRKPKLRKYKQ